MAQKMSSCSDSESSGESSSYDTEQPQQDRALPPASERFLPIANTVRVMRKTLPEWGKISQGSKELVTECASEFISFITSEYVYFLPFAHPLDNRASERCKKDGRKTITGEDLLSSLSTLGFDSYLEPMKTYLYQIREVRLAFINKERLCSDGDYYYLSTDSALFFF